jgi:hypothetical protein
LPFLKTLTKGIEDLCNDMPTFFNEVIVETIRIRSFVSRLTFHYDVYLFMTERDV